MYNHSYSNSSFGGQYGASGYASGQFGSGYASFGSQGASGYGSYGSHGVSNGYASTGYSGAATAGSSWGAATTNVSSGYSGAASSGYSGSASSGANTYQSQIEQQVVQAKQPFQTSEREQISAGQYRGVWLNKQEVESFRGPIPITQYRINEDSNPEVIRKRLDKVRYTQEVAVRYLQPPPAPKPGDIIIREKQSTVPAAPPVILRQEAAGAQDPAPLILRERPPRAPARIGETVVEVDGAPVPPPARRVIVEKMTSLPARPQNVIVEKWLPYQQQKRRVVYEKAHQQSAQSVRNLIIEWEAPEVEVEKVCRNLGVVEADPEEYLRRYGNELKDASELPDCEGGDRCGGSGSSGFRASASAQSGNELPELEGDVQALRLVNLERYGLGAYRSVVGGH